MAVKPGLSIVIIKLKYHFHASEFCKWSSREVASQIQTSLPYLKILRWACHVALKPDESEMTDCQRNPFLPMENVVRDEFGPTKHRFKVVEISEVTKILWDSSSCLGVSWRKLPQLAAHGWQIFFPLPRNMRTERNLKKYIKISVTKEKAKMVVIHPSSIPCSDFTRCSMPTPNFGAKLENTGTN